MMENPAMTHQEQEAWVKACELLKEREGTLSMHLKVDGMRREFEIIYIPMPKGTT
jgi:hypothetical protein